MPEPFAENERSQGPVRFDGSWERSGRSLNSSAVLGLLGIGVLYFNGQSFLAVLTVVLVKFSRGESAPSFDSLLSSFQSFVGPLRIVVVFTQFALMLAPALILVKRWHSSGVRAYVRLGRASWTDVLLA